MARIPSRFISAAAENSGIAASKIRKTASSFDDSTLAREFVARLADTPTQVGTAFADEAGQAAQTAAREAGSTGRRAVTAPAAAVGGTALAGGAAITADQVGSAIETRQQAQTKQDLNRTVQDIMADPTLDPGTKQDLLKQAVDDGLFNSPFDGNGDGGDGLLPFDLPSLFSTEGIVMLIIIVFAFRAWQQRGNGGGE